MVPDPQMILWIELGCQLTLAGWAASHSNCSCEEKGGRGKTAAAAAFVE